MLNFNAEQTAKAKYHFEKPYFTNQGRKRQKKKEKRVNFDLINKTNTKRNVNRQSKITVHDNHAENEF